MTIAIYKLTNKLVRCFAEVKGDIATTHIAELFRSPWCAQRGKRQDLAHIQQKTVILYNVLQNHPTHCKQRVGANRSELNGRAENRSTVSPKRMGRVSA